MFKLFTGVVYFCGSCCLHLGSIKVGRALHHGLLKNVVASPMSFFDMTPSGRILNRFGKDIDAIDMVIPHCLQFWIVCTLSVVFTVIVVTMTTPLILVAIFPAAMLYFAVQVIEPNQWKQKDLIHFLCLFINHAEYIKNVRPKNSIM